MQPANAPIAFAFLRYFMNIRIKISLALWFGLNCVLSNLYVEVLTLVLQNVTVMGSGVFKEVIKVN